MSSRHQHDLHQESPDKATTQKLEPPKIFRGNGFEVKSIHQSSTYSPTAPFCSSHGFVNTHPSHMYLASIMYTCPKPYLKQDKSNACQPRSIYGKHIIVSGRIESGKVLSHTMSQKEVGSAVK
jgi:hypothetical protein